MGEKRRIAIAMVGDVLTRPIGRFGAGLAEWDVSVEHHEIDQHFQILAAPAAEDVLILHTTSDFFLDEADRDEALARMDAYCAAVAQFAAREPALVVVNTIEAPPARIVGLEHLDALELASALDARLFDLARQHPSVSVVDLGGIVGRIGAERALSLQNRLAMRMPYTKVAIDALREAYEQAILERYAARKKVILLDADNTLWGGIVGEDGLEGIAVDRQYPGSVYRRFQSQLIALARTGILLGLVTKNNPGDVEEAFQRRDMPLKLDDFAAVRVNWGAKSDNIAHIAHELNLGLDSMIFIDDNPFELEQVKAALPEVDVYRFDAAKADSALSLLASIPGLKTWSVTAEDVGKAAQYRDERQRNVLKQQTTSLADYLKSLEIELEAGLNRASQVKRISQLTNKTNQFNLTTKRYSEADIARLMEAGAVFDIRLRDRFGDMGVIGVVIVQGREIDSFLLSCRALGRGVEAQVLDHVCRKVGGEGLTARYIPSRKNMMTALFYDANGFEIVERDEDGGTLYRFAGGPTLAHAIPVTEVD
jgi:FkbH-like protein